MRRLSHSHSGLSVFWLLFPHTAVSFPMDHLGATARASGPTGLGGSELVRVWPGNQHGRAGPLCPKFLPSDHWLMKRLEAIDKREERQRERERRLSPAEALPAPPALEDARGPRVILPHDRLSSSARGYELTPQLRSAMAAQSERLGALSWAPSRDDGMGEMLGRGGRGSTHKVTKTAVRRTRASASGSSARLRGVSPFAAARELLPMAPIAIDTPGTPPADADGQRPLATSSSAAAAPPANATPPAKTGCAPAACVHCDLSRSYASQASYASSSLSRIYDHAPLQDDANEPLLPVNLVCAQCIIYTFHTPANSINTQSMHTHVIYAHVTLTHLLSPYPVYRLSSLPSPYPCPLLAHSRSIIARAMHNLSI